MVNFMKYLIILIFMILDSILFFVIPELFILWGGLFTAGILLILKLMLQKKISAFLGIRTCDSQDYDSCINYSDGNF